MIIHNIHLQSHYNWSNVFQQTFLFFNKTLSLNSFNLCLCLKKLQRNRWAIKFEFYRNLHFFNAGVNVKDCVVTWTDDGFVFNDDNLWGKDFQLQIVRTSKIQQTFYNFSASPQYIRWFPLYCVDHRIGKHNCAACIILTWASKVRPEWHRFSALHRMKPGRISSSSMPFRRSLRFSPGPASSVSASSDRRLNTSTVCWIGRDKQRKMEQCKDGGEDFPMTVRRLLVCLCSKKVHQIINQLPNILIN